MREGNRDPPTRSAAACDARIPPVTAAASQIVRLVVPGSPHSRPPPWARRGRPAGTGDPCRARDRVHATHTFEPVRRARASSSRSHSWSRSRALPGPEVSLPRGFSWASMARVRRGVATRVPISRLQHPIVSLAVVMLLSWIALSQLWAETRAETRQPSAPHPERDPRRGHLTAVRKPGQAIGVTAAFVVGATVMPSTACCSSSWREPPRRPAWRAGSATQRARDHPGGRTHTGARARRRAAGIAGPATPGVRGGRDQCSRDLPDWVPRRTCGARGRHARFSPDRIAISRSACVGGDHTGVRDRRLLQQHRLTGDASGSPTSNLGAGARTSGRSGGGWSRISRSAAWAAATSKPCRRATCFNRGSSSGLSSSSARIRRWRTTPTSRSGRSWGPSGCSCSCSSSGSDWSRT